jgi:hypothetical protein
MRVRVRPLAGLAVPAATKAAPPTVPELFSRHGFLTVTGP